MKSMGIIYEKLCRKFKWINFLDKIFEALLNRKSKLVREHKRYKSFIGSYLISNAKCKEITLLSKIDRADNIFEFGCGDGQLLLSIGKKLRCKNIYGVDIDKKRNFQKLKKIYPELNLFLMDNYNSYYNPNGKNKKLILPAAFKDIKFDLIFLYDVVTYMSYNEFIKLINQFKLMMKNKSKFFFNIPVVCNEYTKNLTAKREVKNTIVGSGGESAQIFWSERLVNEFLNTCNFKVSYYPKKFLKNKLIPTHHRFVLEIK